jgi:uncharacterized protein involved in exopolysaccharide biosynthesis
MNQEEKFPQEYEKIDLMDYLKVIKKRKNAIFYTILLFVTIVAVYNFKSPKSFKGATSLEIGSIEDQPLESPLFTIGKIQSDIYGFVIREKLNITKKNYPKINAENPKDTNLIQIKAESTNPEVVINVLEGMNNLILEDHRGKIKLETDSYNNNITRLKNKIASLEEEKKDLIAKIVLMEKTPLQEQTPASQFTLFSIKEKLEIDKQRIEDLYLQINSLEKYLNKIKPAKIIDEPNIPETSMKINLVLNVIIATILGIFVGVFLVFLQEWWDKNKTKI